MVQEISIPDSLYEQAFTLVREMQISPSDLFSLALKDYLRRHHSQKLLQSINDACVDGLDENEQVKRYAQFVIRNYPTFIIRNS
ncbi:hypothetical protein [Scytonema sp. UIC 10036]|uniref:hypothetical protein n=1 Tax=Scytonema sp. UIC 10036 TaxID=2304196 RepID=UPI001A9BE93A|nr:hypothetical protein [Scytonema sp. UIC 10036]